MAVGAIRPSCYFYFNVALCYTQFLHSRIHFQQKVPASEVHAPANGCMPPYGKSWICHCLGTTIGAVTVVSACALYYSKIISVKVGLIGLYDFL